MKFMESHVFTDNQRKRFKKLFTLNYSSIDDNGVLLQKVLNLDPNRVDEEYEMSYDDFNQFLYVKDVKSINTNIERLKKEILKGRKYHYIHSYGKNGKTTFLRRFIKENKDIFTDVFVDFKDFQINRTEKTHSLITKTIEFFDTLLSLYKYDLIENITNVLKHIENTQIDTETNTFYNETRKIYNSLFSSFRVELIDFIDKLIDDSYKELPVKSDSNNEYEILIKIRINLFKNRFESFIDKLLEDEQLKPIELFNFLIILSIKLYGRRNKKTVIIFDNIDDILTHSSEYLTAQIFPQVYDFVKVLNSYLNISNTLIDDTILDDVCFVFSYRTANYVSSIYHLNHNPSSKDRRQELMNAPVYPLSSVKLTHKIILKKLEFYEKICQSFNITASSYLDSLKTIINSFYHSQDDYTYIFKLWNGNHHAFNRVFASIILNKSDISILTNSNVSTNIKRGIFIYYITKSYVKDSNLQINTFSTLSSVFQYTFTSELCKNKNCKCNLLRMFLSYIINHNTQYRKPKEHVNKNLDIFNKGVSFREVLDELTQFKSNGMLVYNKDMFIELFKKIFHDDIDVFDFLIISYKNTDIEKPIKRFGKKYDFSSDIELYFKYIDDKTNSELDKLDSIKLYYNSNSEYLLNPFKKNFEFSSSSIPEGVNPLSQNLKVFQSKKEILFYDIDFEFEYTFNNNEILKSVFNKIENTINSITEFYLESVFNIYPPLEYCNNSFFALNKVFHYDVLISKHITYIEKVRQAFIFNQINLECQIENLSSFESLFFKQMQNKAKSNLNGRFIYWLHRYIQLFNTNFNRISTLSKLNNYEMDEHSKRTKNSFKDLQNKIDKIKKSKFLDFTTKVETSDNK